MRYVTKVNIGGYILIAAVLLPVFFFNTHPDSGYIDPPPAVTAAAAREATAQKLKRERFVTDLLTLNEICEASRDELVAELNGEWGSFNQN